MFKYKAPSGDVKRKRIINQLQILSAFIYISLYIALSDFMSTLLTLKLNKICFETLCKCKLWPGKEPQITSSFDGFYDPLYSI